jgi:hypothetical protein
MSKWKPSAPILFSNSSVGSNLVCMQSEVSLVGRQCLNAKYVISTALHLVETPLVSKHLFRNLSDRMHNNLALPEKR